MEQQITDTIMMVRPAHFGFNPQTAESNAFQEADTDLKGVEIQLLALQEFDQFVQRLQQEGIHVIVVQDTALPKKYDAVFPNNWISTHADGKITTYPMLAPMRRLERREEIIEGLREAFVFTERIHFEQYEDSGQILEGTGSLILDRPNKIAYACKSDRTDEILFYAFCKRFGYQPIFFDAVDESEHPIYHTNVMMSIGKTFAIACLDSIKDKKEWAKVHKALTDTSKEIIEISLAQMNAFAGNMLQVQNKWGDTYLVMSEQAYQSLSDIQKARIRTHTEPLYSPIYTIEKFGGGSTRCMMAEIFLEKK